MARKTRILLVDDHKVVRLGLRALLENESDFELLGEAATAAQAIEMAERLRPDIILMDIRLPDQTGIEACRKIRQQRPEIQVLMLTSFADHDLVMEAIEAGAAGYVLKQLDTTDLLRSIRLVVNGDGVLDPSVTRQVLTDVRKAKEEAQVVAFKDLSEREMEVLALVAQGKTNVEIAKALVLSEKTVRNHVSTILSKLALANRIEAATYAVRHNIERYVSDPEV